MPNLKNLSGVLNNIYDIIVIGGVFMNKINYMGGVPKQVAALNLSNQNPKAIIIDADQQESIQTKNK
jgi:hypothetical protein